MRLNILTDNNTFIDRYYLAEPGLSILIEDGPQKILFDCGFSDVFWHNANIMGHSLLFLDYLVFSHGHLDHTWGVEKLMREHTIAGLENIKHKKPEVVAHPDALKGVGFPPGINIGPLIGPDEMAAYYKMNLSKEPVQITERLIFLGQIPRNNDFEGHVAIGTKIGKSEPDLLPDDTALAYKDERGLIIITGCSHSGICNIVEHARRVCGQENILSIIGGLHLQTPEKKVLEKTCEFISGLNLQTLYAGHCTDLDSKIALAQKSPLREMGSGLVLEF
ncbi:MAG: MBL fold metallo-hydrolase [Thermodesulfobacteriota bacterium]